MFEGLNPDQLRDLFGKLPEEQKDELLKALEEASDAAHRLYIPHPKQKEFHCAPNKIRAVFGGNRSGKTDMGCNEARFHATGRYPDWYPEEQRFKTPTKGRIVVTDYKKGCGEVLEPKLDRWFSPEDIAFKKYSQYNLSKVGVRHASGGISVFDVMTHEQDLMTFEGWSGHWVWFDEPPPREIYVACLRGMVDYGGRMWITATPITEPWLYDEMVSNRERNAWYSTVSIHDNPYISKKDIEEFLVSLTPEEKEAREHGKFLHLVGRIYKMLDEKVHLVDQLPKGHETWPVWFVLDPADRRPHHGIWAKVDPFGTIYVYDEIVYKGTIQETSKQILLRERVKHGIDPMKVIRILDPNKGRTPSAATGLRLVDEFANHAVYFLTSVNDDIMLGHLAVQEKLSWDKSQPISSTNHPKLYFVREDTKECFKQLLAYVWDDWKGKLKGSRSEKQKPKDINKDMPDCVRYLCMFGPKWYDIFDGEKTGFDRTAFTAYKAE